jgi:hypothetical protein
METQQMETAGAAMEKADLGCPGLFMHVRAYACAHAAKTDAKAKAAQAAKAVKKGTYTKKARKPRYSVVFHRPKTLKRSRNPKYLRTR